MLDRFTTRLIKPPLQLLARQCIKQKISAAKITLVGACFAPIVITLIAFEQYTLAILCICLNRICDGLDGEIARLTHTQSVAGAYLDIMMDYVFYISVPVGFYIADPVQNGLASILVLATFTLSATQFLAASTSFTKLKQNSRAYPDKSIFYPVNLIEGTETIVYTLLVCILPTKYPLISYIVVGLILLSLPFLIYSRWRLFSKKQHTVIPETL